MRKRRSNFYELYIAALIIENPGILQSYLRDKTLHDAVDLDKLAAEAEGFSGSDLKSQYSVDLVYRDGSHSSPTRSVLLRQLRQ